MGHRETVTILPGTRAAALYGAAEATEAYYCNYGVNPEYRSRLGDAGIVVSGVGSQGEPRIIELPAHPFFLATLFVPQAVSTPERPHPVIAGLGRAAAAARAAAAHRGESETRRSAR